MSKRLVRARAIREKMQHASADAALEREIREASVGTVNDKAELFRTAAFLRNFRLLGILRLLAREWRHLRTLAT